MQVEVGGRTLEISNQDKVFWPDPAFTKGQLVDYYRAIAEVMVPHLTGRPITLRRWPDGVGGQTFFQKNAPRHRPDWIGTVRLGDVDYLRLDEPAGLAWAANLAAIEIHPGLARAGRLDRPDFVVLDLDPGPPADILTCCRLALVLRGYLDGVGLEAWAKTSGQKGLQLYVPLGDGSTYDDTRPFGEALARRAEADHPDLVVSVVEKARRRGKVLIDWAQNAPSRTTVAVYSVRAAARPTVSTPVTWDEVERAAAGRDSEALRFGVGDVLRRVERMGDLMRPVLEGGQKLPEVRR